MDGSDFDALQNFSRVSVPNGCSKEDFCEAGATATSQTTTHKSQVVQGHVRA